MAKILILGKNGQVGRALAHALGDKAVAADRSDINLLDADFCTKLGRYTPTAIINAAAYTQVDKAEGDDRQAAFRINGSAVGELTGWCKARAVPLVHFSTDYVFDGSGSTPHREDDRAVPINAYGESKLAGEMAIQKSGAKFLIVRTSWVYDARGSNFFNTIRRHMHEKDSINVVADQIGAPTYAPHLANAALAAFSQASQKNAWGIYHLCNKGETSWHGFAQAIFEAEKKYHPEISCRDIHAIPAAAWPTPAKRPLNSRLDCSKARETFGITMPRWEDGLKECFEALK